MILDVETANMTEDALTYDIGFIVADLHNNIKVEKSLIVYDIYCQEKKLMQTAYYAKKLPLYEERIKNKDSQIVSLFHAKKIIRDLMQEYNVKEVYAYNANFDYSALNRTLRYISKSLYRYFFPYGTKICCIWNMACHSICNTKSYARYCIDNNKISKANNCSTNAETVYQYLTDTKDFEEEHTGLSDVMIEYFILLECLGKHTKRYNFINRCCWQVPQKKFKKVLKNA